MNKAIDYINDNSFVINNPNFRYVNEKDAFKAIEIAEQELKDKAIEAFTEFVENYCEESGKTDISSDSGHYIEIFTSLLNK